MENIPSFYADKMHYQSLRPYSQFTDFSGIGIKTAIVMGQVILIPHQPAEKFVRYRSVTLRWLTLKGDSLSAVSRLD